MTDPALDCYFNDMMQKKSEEWEAWLAMWNIVCELRHHVGRHSETGRIEFPGLDDSGDLAARFADAVDRITQRKKSPLWG